MNHIYKITRWVNKKFKILLENFFVFTNKIYYIFYFFTNLVKPRNNDFSEEDIKFFIENHYKNYKPEHTLNVVSEIWREIVKNNTIDVLRLIESNNYKELKNLYDKYHDSSLAIGADDSSLLRNPFFKFRAAVRHQHQIYNYLIHKNMLPIPNKFQPNIGIKNDLKNAEFNIKDIFKNIPDSINLNQFYRFKYSELSIPIDFLDHLYFFEVIESFVGETNQDFIEIGSGTGTLSLILSLVGNHNITMIDLAPFLINQSLLVGNKHSYLPSEYIENIEPRKIRYAVNQDSFPEISGSELIKLIKFINDCHVEYVFSYNQTSNYREQSDYTIMLNQSGFKEIISYISPMREGYKIKIFKRMTA